MTALAGALALTGLAGPAEPDEAVADTTPLWKKKNGLLDNKPKCDYLLGSQLKLDAGLHYHLECVCFGYLLGKLFVPEIALIQCSWFLFGLTEPTS